MGTHFGSACLNNSHAPPPHRYVTISAYYLMRCDKRFQLKTVLKKKKEGNTKSSHSINGGSMFRQAASGTSSDPCGGSLGLKAGLEGVT